MIVTKFKPITNTFLHDYTVLEEKKIPAVLDCRDVNLTTSGLLVQIRFAHSWARILQKQTNSHRQQLFWNGCNINNHNNMTNRMVYKMFNRLVDGTTNNQLPEPEVKMEGVANCTSLSNSALRQFNSSIGLLDFCSSISLFLILV